LAGPAADLDRLKAEVERLVEIQKKSDNLALKMQAQQASLELKLAETNNQLIRIHSLLLNTTNAKEKFDDFSY
jgi:hypothetical protein